MITALLLSAAVAASPVQRSTVLRVGTGAVSASVLHRTAMVIEERLTAAKIAATVRIISAGRIQVTINQRAPLFLSKLLTSPGLVTFRIVPTGDTYRSPNGRAIRRAYIDENPNNAANVTFYTSDPRSFFKFTQAHLGKSLGIFVDGRLLSKATINGPIGAEGEIDVPNQFRSTLPALAAAIGSEPLPTRVTLVASSSVAR